MKHIFIINPTSGKGDGAQAVPLIRSEIEKLKLDAEIIVTEYAGHAQEVAASLPQDRDLIVYACGGDGTINEVLNGLKPGIRMGILPCGTGNDYYRMIDSRKLSFAKMLHETLTGRYVEVDYGITRNERFHNCTTMGLDARVNDLAIELYHKYPLPRFSVYGLAAVICALKPQPFEITVKTEQGTLKTRAILTAVMNGSCYGNGFTAAPQADLQDGLFDICIIEPVSLFTFFRFLPAYRKGNHTRLNPCRMLRASHVSITLNHAIAMQSDGEGFSGDHLDILMSSQKLPLIVPDASPLV